MKNSVFVWELILVESRIEVIEKFCDYQLVRQWAKDRAYIVEGCFECDLLEDELGRGYRGLGRMRGEACLLD